MNEASWPGTRLMKTTPATHLRVEKSTTFPLALPLFCLLPHGPGTCLSVLLVCAVPRMNAGLILMPWNLSSHREIKTLHRSLLESLYEWCSHVSMPCHFWEFSKKHAIRGSSVWTSCLLLKRLYCNKTQCKIYHF